MQALKGIVILMSFAIAVLMTLIVYGMYQKSQNPDFRFFSLSSDKKPAPKVKMAPQAPTPQTPAPQTPVPKETKNVTRATFSDISLGLGPDARVISASIAKNRLALIIAQAGAKDGNLVVIIDLATGRVLGRIKTGP